MSSVYFHTPTQTWRISGAERALFAGWVGDFLDMALGLWRHMDDREKVMFRRVLRPDHYLQRDMLAPGGWDTFASGLRTWVRVAGARDGFIVDGSTVHPWHVALNTAIEAGSEPIALAARIHAQCEVHGYFEAEDLPWLCGVIQQGLDAGMYRAAEGWPALLVELEACRDPVVMSYSVCDQFPPSDPEAVDEDGELTGEPLSWDAAMVRIRAEPSLRISPANIHAVGFGNGWNGWQLMEAIRAAAEAAVGALATAPLAVAD